MLTVEKIQAIVTPLVEPFPVVRVILFGSYARGEATEKSDVDLIIDSEGILSFWELLGLIGDIVTKMPAKVDILDFEEIKKPALFDNISKEGVIIYERKNQKAV